MVTHMCDERNRNRKREREKKVNWKRNIEKKTSLHLNGGLVIHSVFCIGSRERGREKERAREIERERERMTIADVLSRRKKIGS